ncbi:hypothetical protein PJL18_01127 [Paenarthrobacter nicotinovorans]|nr:hypothetical protein [Paenarthrobacter nicotinovorans]
MAFTWTVPDCPICTESSAETFRVLPSTDTLKPLVAEPVSSYFMFWTSSESGSDVSFPRSRLAESPLGTSTSLPRRTGGLFLLGSGRTLVRMLRVDFKPLGSSGPVPSVTSKLMEPGPTYSAPAVYFRPVPPLATGSAPSAPMSLMRSVCVSRGERPSRTFTHSARSTVTDWPETSSMTSSLASVGTCWPMPGTQMMAVDFCPSTSSTV